MLVEHAPPAVRGVQQIMGLGETDLLSTQRTVLYASIGLWAFGFLTGSRTLKNVGLGGAIATWVAPRLAG